MGRGRCAVGSFCKYARGTEARRHGGTEAGRHGGTKARRHGGTEARRGGRVATVGSFGRSKFCAEIKFCSAAQVVSEKMVAVFSPRKTMPKPCPFRALFVPVSCL